MLLEGGTHNGNISTIKSPLTPNHNNNTMGTNLLQWTRPHFLFCSPFSISVCQCWMQFPFHAKPATVWMGSYLKGGMPNLWHMTVSPLQLCVSGEWAAALFSLSLDSRGPSRPTVRLLGLDPFTQTFFFSFPVISVMRITPGGWWGTGYWCVSSTVAEVWRVLMSAKGVPWGDRVETTWAEMSQMSLIHSYRQEVKERGGLLVTGFCREALRGWGWR